MKTSSPTRPEYHFINTAPLAAQYTALMATIMAVITAGQMAKAARLSRQVMKVVRNFIRYDTHNYLLSLKLEMLTHKAWRERVLEDLGGLRKLALWNAAKLRLETKGGILKTAPKNAEPPAWLYTPERLAESERLKARLRLCARAAANPKILRDRVKVDFDGLFRLAPLPRAPQTTRQISVYTAETISDYDWNAMPYVEQKGFAPAVVWPAEFYAAAEAEAECNILSAVIPYKPLAAQMGDQTVEDRSVTLDPPSSALRASCGMTEEKNEREEKITPWVKRGVPLLPPEGITALTALTALPKMALETTMPESPSGGHTA